MWNVGDKVCFTVWIGLDENERQIVLTGTVESTFYEPHDPIQGVSIRAADGQMYGGLDSQNVYPRSAFAKVARHIYGPGVMV